ncbi:MAG TPA: hypothetical protein DEG43_04150, partial [Acidimicrobiaceae bacterium]|nr:hypothetical protein [Acidimicrobiaceae bacterium]
MNLRHPLVVRPLAALSLIGSTFAMGTMLPASASFVASTDVFISGEVAIQDNVGNPNDCTTSQVVADSAARTATEALASPWLSTAAARGYDRVSNVIMPVPTDADRVNSSPTTMSFDTSAVTVDVSYRNVNHLDLAPFNPAAVGSAAVGTDPNAAISPTSYRNPYLPIPSKGTLQDCAPYPTSLYDTSPSAGIQPARQWNALFGSGTALDGTLFEFSTPVAAFGAWFGDLETRPRTDGNPQAPAAAPGQPDLSNGTPAYVKLIAADNTVIWEGIVPAAVNSNPQSSECGGATPTPLACGNQTTRWIGFVTQPGDLPIKRMLVTVGDDDDCSQAALSDCMGSSEHFSWVGAKIAEVDPLTTT